MKTFCGMCGMGLFASCVLLALCLGFVFSGDAVSAGIVALGIAIITVMDRRFHRRLKRTVIGSSSPAPKNALLDFFGIADD